MTFDTFVLLAVLALVVLLLVLLILRRNDEDAAQPVRANLMAPLVVNVERRIGLQRVIARMGCELTLKPLD